MRQSAALLPLLLVLTVSVGGQPAADPSTVATTYHTIASLDTAAQKTMFASLSADMKAALWAHQLTTYDAAHPELTRDQHQLLADAVLLIRSGLFHAVYPNGANALSEEVDRLATATQALFRPNVASAVFAHLGIPEAGSSSPSPFIYSIDCNCNVEHDFCDYGTGVSWCGRLPRCNESSWGCGWAFAQACNGTCS